MSLEFENQFHMLPSEPRQKGFETFLQYLHFFLDNQRPTKIELPIIHKLVTNGLHLPELPEFVKEDAALKILIQGREKLSKLLPRLDSIRLSFENGTFQEVLQTGSFDNIKGTVGLIRRGALRRFGKRMIEGQPPKTIYASHTKPIENGNYLGLSEDLDSVFDELCDTYDRLMADASDQDLDNKLKVIAYFQLWGASVGHFFWDANGRAFSAHLVRALNQIGFPVDEVPKAPEIHSCLSENILSTLGPNFLLQFLAMNKIRLLTDLEAAQLPLNNIRYREYMNGLKEAIHQGIGAELTPQFPLDEYIKIGARFLKVYLSKVEFISRDTYEQEAPKITEAILSQIADQSK